MASPQPVEIRDAGPDDADEIVACVRAAYSPYVERIGRTPAPMGADYPVLIGRNLVRVALREDRLVGLIVMWPEADHLHIDNIAVAPSAQATGVGSRLLDDAVERAAREDRGELRLYTNAAMVENLEYYAAKGFTETHRASEAGFERVYFSQSL